MLAGIREILIISTPHDLPLFKKLLGSGEQWGISISFLEQAKPEGLVQAFLIGEDFINDEPICLILGDNIFYGQGLPQTLQQSARKVENGGAVIFGYRVSDPQRYGVVKFDSNYQVSNIEEKPITPQSNYAVTGLYFYDKNVCRFAKNVRPSARNELEITSLNNIYLAQNSLSCTVLGRGMAWLDTGTPESLTEASSYFRAIETRQGLKVSCPEEIAVHMGFMSKEMILESICGKQSEYYDYIRNRFLE